MAVQRLTITQAAHVLNTSEAVVQKRINLGVLKSEQEPDGQVYVLLDSSDANSEQDKTAEIQSLIAAKDEVLSEQRGRIAFLERALEGKDKILLSMTEAIKSSNQPQTTGVSETPHEVPTQGEWQRGVGFLPERENTLPFWLYALAVIAPAAIAACAYYVPNIIRNAFNIYGSSSAYDIVTFPLHFLPTTDLVPLAIGFWIGLKRSGSSWPVYAATGFCAGLLLAIVRWFIDIIVICDLQDTYPDCVSLISPFLAGFAVAVLIVAGALFGNAVQRRGLRMGLYYDELTARERAAEGRSDIRVALLGLAATIIASTISAFATVLGTIVSGN
jgi:hypothetical protein